MQEPPVPKYLVSEEAQLRVVAFDGLNFGEPFKLRHERHDGQPAFRAVTVTLDTASASGYPTTTIRHSADFISPLSPVTRDTVRITP
jgi:hypothetical protein